MYQTTPNKNNNLHIALRIPLCLALFSWGLLHSAIVNAQYEDISVSKVISVYDGDTFRADLTGYPDIIGKSIPIRLNGIDTPEVRGQCPKEKELALEAREALTRLLFRANDIKLKNVRRGKYFRIVADVYIKGVNASHYMVQHGYATRYSGNAKKDSWCASQK